MYANDHLFGGTVSLCWLLRCIFVIRNFGLVSLRHEIGNKTFFRYCAFLHRADAQTRGILISFLDYSQSKVQKIQPR